MVPGSPVSPTLVKNGRSHSKRRSSCASTGAAAACTEGELRGDKARRMNSTTDRGMRRFSLRGAYWTAPKMIGFSESAFLPGRSRIPGIDGGCDIWAGLLGGMLSESDTGIVYRVQAALDTGPFSLVCVIPVLTSTRDPLSLQGQSFCR